MSNLSRLKTSLAIITGLVIFSITPVTQAAGYGTGVLEFQMKLATNGNANAQYRLATMFESGHGTTQDQKKAMLWYKKAADQNHKAAINRLTYIDIRKNGFKGSHKTWLNALEKAASSRDGESMLLLGQMHSNGIAVTQNNTRAIELLKQAKAKGVTGAEDELDKIENQIHSSRQQKRQQEIDKQKQEAARRAKQEDKRRAAAAKSQAQRENAERRKLAAEERRKAAELKRRQQAEKHTASKKQSQPQNEQFESDICKGKKARFLTACK